MSSGYVRQTCAAVRGGGPRGRRTPKTGSYPPVSGAMGGSFQTGMLVGGGGGGGGGGGFNRAGAVTRGAVITGGRGQTVQVFRFQWDPPVFACSVPFPGAHTSGSHKIPLLSLDGHVRQNRGARDVLSLHVQSKKYGIKTTVWFW